MDKLWLIRSGIFLTAGLWVLLFPKIVYKFQMFVGGKLRLKVITEWEYNRKTYTIEGLFFIAISIIIFFFNWGVQFE